MKFGPFLGLGFLLVVLWLAGFVFFHVAGFFLYLLLVFAIVSFLIHVLYSPGKPA